MGLPLGKGWEWLGRIWKDMEGLGRMGKDGEGLGRIGKDWEGLGAREARCSLWRNPRETKLTD